ncbi:MAG: ribosome biogenesis GTP-binding protein YihA/YsxC [Bacilli bacterium]|jgi:GTP-binding protein
MPKKMFFSAEFIKSAVSRKDFLFDRPAFSFLGRSNVGKSTLINSLLRRKGFMKTSKTPGLTRFVNYALIDNRFYLTDVPGYGFATFERKSFQGLMKDYLEDNSALKKVYLLIDSRRLLMPADDQFADYLDEIKLPYAFVFTKCDKLSSSDKHYLKLQIDKLAPVKCFEVSSSDEASLELLRKDIYSSL